MSEQSWPDHRGYGISAGELHDTIIDWLRDHATHFGNQEMLDALANEEERPLEHTIGLMLSLEGGNKNETA